jgi:hypothetical protein
LMPTLLFRTLATRKNIGRHGDNARIEALTSRYIWGNIHSADYGTFDKLFALETKARWTGTVGQ